MKDIYDLYDLIGKNMKKLRKEYADKSLDKMAEDIDMSRGYLSRIESPKIKTGVSIDTLFAMSQKYNFDIRLFFDGYEDMIKDEDN